jgi:hypothetical protein
MYYERYQAHINIFEKIPTLEVSSQFILRPLIYSLIDVEAEVYQENSSSESVRRYLPNAFANTKELALERIQYLVQGHVLKLILTFCIAFKENKVPFGYILCNSPLASFSDKSGPIGKWTIDFWLNEEFGGHGIVTACLKTVLFYLKQMLVPAVYFYIEFDNVKAIRIMNRLGILQTKKSSVVDKLEFSFKLQ